MKNLKHGNEFTNENRDRKVTRLLYFIVGIFAGILIYKIFLL